MLMKRDGITPKEILPRCIIIKLLSGHVLNAVRLTSPGAKTLLDSGLWQQREEPFFISFMAIEKTKADRLEELEDFCTLLLDYLEEFKAPVALQINFGCPNTDLDLDELSGEVLDSLEVAGRLGIPLVPLEVLAQASQHPCCDAFWIANTIPWGTEGIDWKGIFGTDVSPLQARGFSQAGGLSGPACRPIVTEKLLSASEVVGDLPMVGGNGIQSADDILSFKRCGVVAVAIGTVTMVRHWRTQNIIQTANRVFGEG
jgi:dihydroorotate dehydrogenase